MQERDPPNLSPFYTIWVILIRSLKTVLRNPMDLGLKIIQVFFIFAMMIIVYGRINIEDTMAYQNVRGIIFFISMIGGYAGIQGTLATFASERSIFIRERYSRTYSIIPYFLGRTLAN